MATMSDPHDGSFARAKKTSAYLIPELIISYFFYFIFFFVVFEFSGNERFCA